MSYADRACNLECQKGVKTGDGTKHEFVGPVKIILVDPSPAEYKRKICGSAVISLAMILMGASVFTVLFFTLSFRIPQSSNMHVFFCTVGFQLLMPSGILMFSSLFGGSVHLKNPDRRFQHFFIQLFAICFCVFGGLIAFFDLGIKYTIHSVSGFGATILIVTSSLIGPTVYFSNPAKATGYFNRQAHIYCALPTVFLSTVSFITGLSQESFLKWAPVKDLNSILSGFTILYILAVLLSVLLRLKYGY